MIAAVEANLGKGSPLFRKLIDATGLTRDQLRHRRDKPLYQEYLEKERNKTNKHNLSFKTTKPDKESSSSPAAPPSVGHYPLTRRLAQQLTVLNTKETIHNSQVPTTSGTQLPISINQGSDDEESEPNSPVRQSPQRRPFSTEPPLNGKKEGVKNSNYIYPK